MKKRKEHEFDFMGHCDDGNGDYAYCALCKKWCRADGKLFTMSSEKYQKLVDDGVIYGL